MSTSTLQTYYIDGINYIWDSVHGFFNTAGGMNFLISVAIMFAIISLAILAVKRIFSK